MWQRCAQDLIRYWAPREEKPSTVMHGLQPREETLASLRDRKIDSLYYLCESELSPIQLMYDAAWRQQRSAVCDVISAFQQQGIEALTFKGAEFLASFMHGHAISRMVDCDLLLRRHDVNRARATMFEAGFRQTRPVPVAGKFLDADIAEIAETESRHYELFPFSKLVLLESTAVDPLVASGEVFDPVFLVNGKLYLRLTIDLHHGVATDIGADQFFDRSVPSSLGRGSTFSSADHLWFTTSRYYHEVALYGKRSLRDLVFVGMLLHRMPINWNVVLSAAAEYDFRPSLYYLFAYLKTLTAAPIPDAVLDELCPNRGSRQRDWGWQLGVLFDIVESMPETQTWGAT
jgi:hypothetical protein